MIDHFRDKYFFLSNFYPGKGNTLEHEYQAAKFLNPEHQAMILSQPKPGKAKRLARELTAQGFKRSDWEEINLDIMLKLVRNKFSQSHLTKLLLETGDEHLVEGNDYQDRFWGCVKSRGGDWIGENHLGRILMQVRNELKYSEEINEPTIVK